MRDFRVLRPSASRAVLLVAALLIGIAAHAWHHVADHDCDTAPGPVSHVCGTCSALHAAPLAAEGAACPAPDVLPQAGPLAPALEAPAARAIARVAPRAPPTA